MAEQYLPPKRRDVDIEFQAAKIEVTRKLENAIADPSTPEALKKILEAAKEFQERQEREIERLKAENRSIAEASLHDKLTGIPGREKYEKALERTIQQSAASAQPPIYVVASIDLGKFKQINDTYGHIAGDQVLIGVAKALQKELRIEDVITQDVSDIAARIGGDEFRLLMRFKPDTAEDVIATRLTTIQHNLGSKDEYKITLDNEAVITPNLSMGAVAFAKPEENYSTNDYALLLLNVSDALMYQNKTARKQDLNQTDLKVPVVMSPDKATAQRLMREMAEAMRQEVPRYASPPSPPSASAQPPSPGG
jgi:diguanylate cyclase (GGDEF)-like protein